MANVLALLFVCICGIVGLTEALPSNDTVLSAKEICMYLPLNTTILQPQSCNKWLKCSESAQSDNYEDGSCVAGLYFDRNNGKCDYATNVICPYDEVQQTIHCDGKHDEYLADPANCNNFIYCKDGAALYSHCPTDMVFHPTNQSCVYKSQYTCSTQTQITFSNPICRSLPDQQKFADDEDCTKYHICDMGKLESKTCEPAMAYDYATGICVSASSVKCYPTAKAPEPENKICDGKTAPRVGYLSDGETCSGYYYCTDLKNGQPDRHPTHYSCPNGQFFHESSWTCRDRLNVPCAMDRCDGVNQKYVNVAGDCSAYAYCVNGTTLSSGKCSGDLYFDERTQGCVYNKVNYAACN